MPLGYRAAGRTLVIDPEEAEIVRTLFDLYRRHGSIRVVTGAADGLGLRSKNRSTRHGSSGGIPFGRGHLHYFLTNPVYAGRIRHRGQIHAGQHEPIIESATWQAMQKQMATKATRQRGHTSAAGSRSPLAGKLVDETGDRLTPSHATKQATRYRYYVSGRLIRGGTDKASDGWRLPAPALEDQIARAISAHLERLGPQGLVSDLTAEGYGRLDQSLRDALDEPLAVLRQASIAPGSIEIQLDEERLRQALGIQGTDLSDAACTFSSPFQQRRRGVETKLILGDAGPDPDQTLIRHIATARRWLELIKAGQSFEEIAAAEEIPKRRV